MRPGRSLQVSWSPMGGLCVGKDRYSRSSTPRACQGTTTAARKRPTLDPWVSSPSAGARDERRTRAVRLSSPVRIAPDRRDRSRPLVRGQRAGHLAGDRASGTGSRRPARRHSGCPRPAARSTSAATGAPAVTAAFRPDGRSTPPRRRSAGSGSRRASTVVDRYQALTALWLGALTVATWPVVQAAAGPGLPLLGIVAHVCGMLAGYGVLVLLVLMSRAPALERGVGADVLARWHSWGGRVVVGLVVVHGWAATSAWAQARGLGLLGGAWEVLGMPGLVAATLGTLIMLVVAGVSARAARKRLRHETWHGLHLLMYLAIALSFSHMLAGPDLAGHLVLQIAWALAYTHVFALVLRYRVLAPLRQAGRHRLRVSEVRAEGAGVVSILIEGQHLEELHAEAGQFFRWRFLTPDHWLNAHPFSLSAAPTDTTLRLTVKALGDGSRNLQNLPIGTWVVAEGPYGAVTSARRTQRNVLLVAGGVGITPMRALFESLPVAPGADLLLLYRARTAEELIFRGELEDIARRRGARLTYVLGEGRDALSATALQRMVPDLPMRDVYVCGPPGLMTAVRTSLHTAGLPPEQLHEERFSL